MARIPGLLDSAKPSEVDWAHLAAMDSNVKVRGGCESWVYFISEADSDLVKIGFAKNPVARRRGMQTGNPRALRVERVIIGDQKTERLLHRAFSSSRVDGTSEWFHGRQEILDAARAIGEAQSEMALDADMAEMEAVAVETTNELEREIIGRDESRVPAANGIGYAIIKA